MTQFPYCLMGCEYYKNNLNSCEKYREIQKEIASGKQACKEYKKIN